MFLKIQNMHHQIIDRTSDHTQKSTMVQNISNTFHYKHR